MKLSKLIPISLLSLSTLLSGCKPNQSLTYIPRTPIIGNGDEDISNEKSYEFDIQDESVTYRCEIFNRDIDPYCDMCGITPLGTYTMGRIGDNRVRASGVEIRDRHVKIAIRAVKAGPLSWNNEETFVLFVFEFTTNRSGKHIVTFNFRSEELNVEYGSNPRR